MSAQLSLSLSLGSFHAYHVTASPAVQKKEEEEKEYEITREHKFTKVCSNERGSHADVT